MSKSSLLGIAVFVAAVILSIITAWAYFGTKPSKSTKNSSLPTPPVQKQTVQDQYPGMQVNVPIYPKNPAVKWFFLNYGFQGKIVDIKKTGNESELVLDISSNARIPKFVITNKTAILIERNGEKITGSIKSLKPNETVNVSTFYYPGKKAWSTVSITILGATKTSSTPSATTNP